tara:strand:+ start:191 stop:493 length:303 start_codon:yes stop_codon:yes gene_type:complete
MSHFGDLLKGNTAPTPEPVVPAVTAPTPEPVVPAVTEPDPIADIAATTPPAAIDVPSDLKWLSKIKLEEIGRDLGIELDRRLSQPKLVEQLEEHIANMNA